MHQSLVHRDLILWSFVIIPHRKTRLFILNLFLRVVEAIAQSRIEKIDSTQLGNVHFNHLVQTNIKFYGS